MTIGPFLFLIAFFNLIYPLQNFTHNILTFTSSLVSGDTPTQNLDSNDIPNLVVRYQERIESEHPALLDAQLPIAQGMAT